jgi:hypothetical protein
MFLLKPYIRPGLAQVDEASPPDEDFPAYGAGNRPLVGSDIYGADGDGFDDDDKES